MIRKLTKVYDITLQSKIDLEMTQEKFVVHSRESNTGF